MQKPRDVKTRRCIHTTKALLIRKHCELKDKTNQDLFAKDIHNDGWNSQQPNDNATQAVTWTPQRGKGGRGDCPAPVKGKWKERPMGKKKKKKRKLNVFQQSLYRRFRVTNLIWKDQVIATRAFQLPDKNCIWVTHCIITKRVFGPPVLAKLFPFNCGFGWKEVEHVAFWLNLKNRLVASAAVPGLHQRCTQLEELLTCFMINWHKPWQQLCTDKVSWSEHQVHFCLYL